MSRMTLLKGELWLGDAAPDGALPNFVRSPQTGGYPPYNIELLAAEDGTPSVLRITLAVAGFGLDELAVTVEAGELTVRGSQAEELDRDFLYRGIAARRFKRSFGLAEGVEVRKAELHNGLLSIELERPVKEATVKTVRIVDGDKTGTTREAPASRGATVSDAE